MLDLFPVLADNESMNTEPHITTATTEADLAAERVPPEANDAPSRWNNWDTVRRLAAFRAEFGLKQATFAELVGISVRRLSTLENQKDLGKVDASTRRNVLEAIELLRGLGDIMKREFVATWLTTPLEPLDGRSPLEAVAAGYKGRVWELVYRVGSGMPF